MWGGMVIGSLPEHMGARDRRGEPVAHQRRIVVEAETLTPLLLRHDELAAVRRRVQEQGPAVAITARGAGGHGQHAQEDKAPLKKPLEQRSTCLA